MIKLSLAIALAASIAVPAIAQARDVTFTTELKDYGGDGAYLALYLVDADGKYQRTLWVAGKKTKYYKHLADWARGSGQKSSEYDGVTGASVLSGRTLETKVTIPDELIDAGYEVRVDTAVEDMRDNRADVIAPLTSDGAGKAVRGRGYVQSLSYTF